MKPIAFIDLETTGTNTETDRIVQIGVVKVEPTLLKVIARKEALINPEIPIPKSASDIHGITADKVKEAGTFRQYASSLNEFLAGCDIGGFNILKFDIPLLTAEFRRAGIAWPEVDARFIDAFVIFAQKERRDLGAAVKFYTGKDHEGAHGAMADIMGTIEVLRAQVDRYEDLTGLDTEGLHKFCWGSRVDLAGTMEYNEEGVAVYTIGKAKGKPVISDPGFGNWMLKGEFSEDTKKHVRRLLGYK